MIVQYVKDSKESAYQLAKALKATLSFAYDQENYNGKLVFNYGSSLKNKSTQNYINKPENCRLSIDKRITLSMLSAAKLPTVEFALCKEDVGHWGTVVARCKVDGKGNDGLIISDKPKSIPDAPLYTKYYNHKGELRIVVFKEKVIARYLKERNKKDEWDFIHLDSEGFDLIDTACVKATKILGLDYTGVDVLFNSPEKFRILEVNSAPVLTNEVCDILVKELNNV